MISWMVAIFTGFLVLSSVLLFVFHRKRRGKDCCPLCGSPMEGGVCPHCGPPEIRTLGEVCPTCGIPLVDGVCPNGGPHINHYRCPICHAVLKNGVCPKGFRGPEFCPTCGSELVNGECPRSHTIVRCLDCDSIISEGVCSMGCDAKPLNLGWPGGSDKALGTFALKVVECPNPKDRGFTLNVPNSFIVGRSSMAAKEPFVELLAVSRKEKAQCSRQYLRMDLNPDGRSFTVTLLNSSRNSAWVDGKRITMQSETATIQPGGRIRLTPNYELELVFAAQP